MRKEKFFRCLNFSSGIKSIKEGITDNPIRSKPAEGATVRKALQIKFNLPNGCYATVALRQVTGFDMGKTNMAVRDLGISLPYYI